MPFSRIPVSYTHLAKIDDIFGSEWVHLAFVYDGNTSTITVYRNGEGVFTKELPDCGKMCIRDRIYHVLFVQSIV